MSMMTVKWIRCEIPKHSNADISKARRLLGYDPQYDFAKGLAEAIVVTGAEKLQKRLADAFRELTGLSIIEGYGCTEMSPIVSLNLPKDFLAVGREAGPEGSIGVAMPGIAARIVDVDTGELLDAGREGLLQLKSASVMLGYLDGR